MGVKKCNRNNCPHILCDRYSSIHGYICCNCFEELVKSEMDISSFMETSPKPDKEEERRKELEKEFIF